MIQVMKRYGCDVLVDDSVHVRKGVRLAGLWAFFALMYAVTLGQECCKPPMGQPPMNGANQVDIRRYVLHSIGAVIDAPQPGFHIEGISRVQEGPYMPCKNVASTLHLVGHGDCNNAVGRAISYLAVANVDEVWIMAVVESPISPEQEALLQRLRTKVAYLKGQGIRVRVQTTMLSANHPSDLPEGEVAPECCGVGELPEKVTTQDDA